MDGYRLGDLTMPDEPGIERMERTGLAPGEEPENAVYCPVCGRECETIYQDMYANSFGCEWCVVELDANLWAHAKND